MRGSKFWCHELSCLITWLCELVYTVVDNLILLESLWSVVLHYRKMFIILKQKLTTVMLTTDQTWSTRVMKNTWQLLLPNWTRDNSRLSVVCLRPIMSLSIPVHHLYTSGEDRHIKGIHYCKSQTRVSKMRLALWNPKLPVQREKILVLINWHSRGHKQSSCHTMICNQ
jgi:hypothetical protein